MENIENIIVDLASHLAKYRFNQPVEFASYSDESEDILDFEVWDYLAGQLCFSVRIDPTIPYQSWEVIERGGDGSFDHMDYER